MRIKAKTRKSFGTFMAVAMLLTCVITPNSTVAAVEANREVQNVITLPIITSEEEATRLMQPVQPTPVNVPVAQPMQLYSTRVETTSASSVGFTDSLGIAFQPNYFMGMTSVPVEVKTVGTLPSDADIISFKYKIDLVKNDGTPTELAQTEYTVVKGQDLLNIKLNFPVEGYTGFKINVYTPNNELIKTSRMYAIHLIYSKPSTLYLSKYMFANSINLHNLTVPGNSNDGTVHIVEDVSGKTTYTGNITFNSMYQNGDGAFGFDYTNMFVYPSGASVIATVGSNVTSSRGDVIVDVKQMYGNINKVNEPNTSKEHSVLFNNGSTATKIADVIFTDKIIINRLISDTNSGKPFVPGVSEFDILLSVSNAKERDSIKISVVDSTNQTKVAEMESVEYEYVYNGNIAEYRYNMKVLKGQSIEAGKSYSLEIASSSDFVSNLFFASLWPNSNPAIYNAKLDDNMVGKFTINTINIPDGKDYKITVEEVIFNADGFNEFNEIYSTTVQPKNGVFTIETGEPTYFSQYFIKIENLDDYFINAGYWYNTDIYAYNYIEFADKSGYTYDLINMSNLSYKGFTDLYGFSGNLINPKIELRDASNTVVGSGNATVVPSTGIRLSYTVTLTKDLINDAYYDLWLVSNGLTLKLSRNSIKAVDKPSVIFINNYINDTKNEAELNCISMNSNGGEVFGLVKTNEFGVINSITDSDKRNAEMREKAHMPKDFTAMVSTANPFMSKFHGIIPLENIPDGQYYVVLFDLKGYGRVGSIEVGAEAVITGFSLLNNHFNAGPEVKINVSNGHINIKDVYLVYENLIGETVARAKLISNSSTQSTFSYEIPATLGHMRYNVYLEVDGKIVNSPYSSAPLYTSYESYKTPWIVGTYGYGSEYPYTYGANGLNLDTGAVYSARIYDANSFNKFKASVDSLTFKTFTNPLIKGLDIPGSLTNSLAPGRYKIMVERNGIPIGANYFVINEPPTVVNPTPAPSQTSSPTSVPTPVPLTGTGSATPTAEPTAVASGESIPKAADVNDKVSDSINSGKNAEIIVTGNTGEVEVTGGNLLKLAEKGLSLKITGNKLSVTLDPELIKSLNLKGDNNIEISFTPIKASTSVDVSQIDPINKKLLEIAQEVTLSVNGTEYENFTKPLTLSFSLKDLKLTGEQKSKLTGIRFLETGTYQQLGGKIIIGDIFELKTSKLSKYGVLVSDNLKSIVLSANKSDYIVNGINMAMDASPVVIDDYTMVPIRFIAEALGAEVEWIGWRNMAVIKLDGKELSFRIGSEYAQRDMEVQPVIINERTYVPLRYVSEKLGANVIWNANGIIEIYR